MTAERQQREPEPRDAPRPVEPDEPESEEEPDIPPWPDVAKPAREHPPEIPGG